MGAIKERRCSGIVGKLNLMNTHNLAARIAALSLRAHHHHGGCLNHRDRYILRNRRLHGSVWDWNASFNEICLILGIVDDRTHTHNKLTHFDQYYWRSRLLMMTVGCWTFLNGSWLLGGIDANENFLWSWLTVSLYQFLYFSYIYFSFFLFSFLLKYARAGLILKNTKTHKMTKI